MTELNATFFYQIGGTLLNLDVTIIGYDLIDFKEIEVLLVAFCLYILILVTKTSNTILAEELVISLYYPLCPFKRHPFNVGR